MQVEYGAKANAGLAAAEGIPAFNPAKPARIIMGHMLTYRDPGQGLFHDRLPVNATYRYIAMLREPYAWVQSLYFHFHDGRGRESAVSTNAASDMRAFVTDHLTRCSCLLRDHSGPQLPRCTGSGLLYWLAPSTSAQCGSHHACRVLVDAWETVAVVLVSEQFEMSLALLRLEFGLSVTTLPKPYSKNQAPSSTYAQTLTFADAGQLSALVASTCMHEIYCRVRQRFEDMVSASGLLRLQGPSTAYMLGGRSLRLQGPSVLPLADKHQ